MHPYEKRDTGSTSRIYDAHIYIEYFHLSSTHKSVRILFYGVPGKSTS